MLGLGLATHKANSLLKNIVKDGLVLWLDGRDFKNSPPTTTWKDRSGKGNDATASNFVYTAASGSNGQGGVVFDGVDDYLTIPHTETLNLGKTGTSYTVCLNLNIISAARTIEKLGSKYPFSLQGSLFALYDGAKNPFVNNTFNLSTNNVMTYVVKRGISISAYKNGTLVATTPDTTTGDIINTNPITVMKGTSTYGKGTIKSIMIYNRALTDAEILKNYKASR